MRSLLLLCLLILLSGWAGAQRYDAERGFRIYWGGKHERAKKVAEAIHFQPGDTVADVGTGNGFFIAVLSQYTHGVTYYLEDLESALWNRDTFDRALAAFATFRPQPSANRFHHRAGTERSTGLPVNAFDKVLLMDTYHHFEFRDDMLTDIIALLKPAGKLAIMEAIARKSGDKHKGCKKTIFTEAEIEGHLVGKGMKLERKTFIDRAGGRKHMVLIFTRG